MINIIIALINYSATRDYINEIIYFLYFLRFLKKFFLFFKRI